jgi:hypothetical protein
MLDSKGLDSSRQAAAVNELFARRAKKKAEVSWSQFLMDYINAEDDYRDNAVEEATEDSPKYRKDYDFHAKVQYPYAIMELTYNFVTELKSNMLWQVFDATKLLGAMNNLQRTFAEYQHVYTTQVESVTKEFKTLITMMENPEVIEFIKQGVNDKIFNASEYNYWQEKLEKLYYTIKREEAPEEVSFYEDSMSDGGDE